MSQNVFNSKINFLNRQEEQQWEILYYLFLSEMFMSRFKMNIKNTNNNFPNVWIKYIDDIFAIVEKHSLYNKNKMISVFSFIIRFS